MKGKERIQSSPYEIGNKVERLTVRDILIKWV